MLRWNARLAFAPRLRATALLLGIPLALAKPASVAAQASSARVDSLIRAMTLDEKLGFLHGARDPEPAVGLNSAGYMPGVPRLGIPPLRLTDGPAGIRTSAPATALPAPVALAASFDTGLARRYGAVMGREGLARNQDVLLAPMVNIVRVPQAGRNFETLGEDPLLASRLVVAEIGGIQGAGLIATVKHYAANNFENQRQRVDARVDARTLNEIYFPAFEAAAKAGVGSAMCSYNRVNGTYACSNRQLLTDALRNRFGFTGWVMTDWFAAHDLSALQAGLDQEMPGVAFGRGGVYFADSLRDAVRSGRIPESAVDQAVRRILTQMDRFGLLSGTPRTRPAIDTAADAAVARDVAERGAVLLRNERGVLPIARENLASIVVIGPTAKMPLVGGGGSAHVLPFHRTSALAALERRAGVPIRYFAGIDLDGEAVPATAFHVSPEGAAGLTRTAGAPAGRFPGTAAAPEAPAAAPRGPAQTDAQIDFTGARALPQGSAWTWTGVITAPATGEYDLKLQTDGGRGTLSVADTLRAQTGGFGGASLIPTSDGLTNSTTTLHLAAGRPLAIRVTIDGRQSPQAAAFGGGAEKPLQVRLAWSTPEHRRRLLAEAAAAARGARHVLVFAHDEGTEGSDRSSLALPARQDALIDAVTRANPRAVVVLNTGSVVLMPWVARTGAVLQVWYPGEEGGEATAALLVGEANPAGKLPVTFVRRAADAPTSVVARYPGVDQRADYSEGNLVGYRWYDTKGVAPLFPFGHGLSYTHFAYSGLAVRPGGDGFDVSFRVRNTGRVRGAEVPQVYVGAPASPPEPMPVKQLAGFDRVELAPGEERPVTIHVGARELAYWSPARGDWEVAVGRRDVLVGSSSRDIRLRGTLMAASSADGVR